MIFAARLHLRLRLFSAMLILRLRLTPVAFLHYYYIHFISATRYYFFFSYIITPFLRHVTFIIILFAMFITFIIPYAYYFFSHIYYCLSLHIVFFPCCRLFSLFAYAIYVSSPQITYVVIICLMPDMPLRAIDFITPRHIFMLHLLTFMLLRLREKKSDEHAMKMPLIERCRWCFITELAGDADAAMLLLLIVVAERGRELALETPRLIILLALTFSSDVTPLRCLIILRLMP